MFGSVAVSYQLMYWRVVSIQVDDPAHRKDRTIDKRGLQI
jgi:hypothetical protein